MCDSCLLLYSCDESRQWVCFNNNYCKYVRNPKGSVREKEIKTENYRGLIIEDGYYYD